MRLPLFVALLSLLWLTPAPVLAQAAQETQPLSTATLQAAVNTAAQQSPASATRQRSMGRTLGGLALVTAGAMIPFNWGSQCPAGQERSYLGYDCYADAEKEVTAAYAGSGARLGAGLGMIDIGALLITVWSDVPVVRNVTVSPLPRGTRVAASFAF